MPHTRRCRPRLLHPLRRLFRLLPDRGIQVGDQAQLPSSEKPEGPPRHGDYSYFKKLENGGTVGSLHLFKPREAIFIIWDGEVIAGPLTTVEQVEEAFEMLSRESAAEHELRMDIMRRYPTDRKKRYRVYDAKGKLIREEDN